MATTQRIKKNRDPRWEEEFQFTLEEPPMDDKLHVEVISTSSRMGLLHPKVHIAHSLMQIQMTFCFELQFAHIIGPRTCINIFLPASIDQLF